MSISNKPEIAKPKIAMLGFDAAEFGYIQQFLPMLPNFRRALSCGRHRRLSSPAQMMTGSVWPTFYTATPPGEHGIHHLMQWDADAMRLRRVSAAWFDCEPFWRELERRGLRVIALDVPMTFPPKECAGVEVSSWGAHDQISLFTAYPRELGAEIMKRFGAHPMGIEVPVEKSLGERMRVRKNLVSGIAIKSELTRWLLTSRPWDFFIGVFGESHRGGHILWPDGPDTESSIPASALLDVYRALDDALGNVLAAINLENTTVIIFALHGMGANLSQEHFVTPLMDRVNLKFSELEPGFYPTGRTPRQRSAMRLLRENVPPWLQSKIANLVPQHVRDAVVDRSYTSGRDWRHTPGLALRADNNGYIRFNLAGREADGMLEPGSASFARYSELVRDSFQSLRTADGRRIVDDVYFSAEMFPGKRTHHLPDLIVTWNGLEPASRVDSALGTIVGELDTGRGGNHLASGFEIVLRPGVEQSGEDEPLAITELAPMVLRSFREATSGAVRAVGG
jgi:predicted AlkP superfamily phosphohydrolase/phosphomutase